MPKNPNITKLKVESKKLKDLIPSEYNPRQSTKAQEKALSESLQKYGCVEPIIVNEHPDRYNIIIGGHFRVRELMKLRIEEVECVIVNLPLDEEKELNIRLNSNTGEWNFDLLLQNFNLDELDSWGFDTEQLEELAFKTEEDKVESLIEDDVPEIPAEPKSKLGDLFYLGEHRLLCGDSTDPELVKKLMTDTKGNSKFAELVITDPPYNVAYEKSKQHKKILNDEMSKEDFYEFLLKVFKNYNDIVLKDGGIIYVFHSDSERINFTKAFIDADLYHSQILVWVKNHIVLGRQDYQNKHEPILYGWKKGKGHYFIDDRTKSTVFEDELDFKKLKKDELVKLIEEILNTKGEHTTIIHENKPNKSDLHPTMKPIKLIGKLIINSSKKDELVVDLFGGSGSTLIAAEQLNRQCFLMELDPHYCDVIIERWQNLTGEEAFREDGIKYNEI